MKKILVVILALVMAVSLFVFAGCKKKETLYVYTNSGFAPFEYTQGTEVVGVDIEIAKAIAKELDMKMVIKDVPFESVLAGITDENSIGLAGLTITEKRAQSVDFSIAYYGDAIQYVIYPDNELTTDEDLMVTADQLKNKTLGVQTGTTGALIAGDESETDGLFEGATVKEYDDAHTATLAIGVGCDYVIIDRLTALQLVSENEGLEASQIAGMDDEEYGVAVKKGNTELLEVINTVIERLLDEGKIAQWIEEHSKSIED